MRQSRIPRSDQSAHAARALSCTSSRRPLPSRPHEREVEVDAVPRGVGERERRAVGRERAGLSGSRRGRAVSGSSLPRVASRQRERVPLVSADVAREHDALVDPAPHARRSRGPRRTSAGRAARRRARRRAGASPSGRRGTPARPTGDARRAPRIASAGRARSTPSSARQRTCRTRPAAREANAGGYDGRDDPHELRPARATLRHAHGRRALVGDARPDGGHRAAGHDLARRRLPLDGGVPARACSSS